MKTRNVNLENTPLLINNISRKICLKAPSLMELKKKIKEYEILLARCLTNAYRLSNLSLDKNHRYTILPDGNYQASIFLNFSGKKKEEISNPERTLQYIKHLTGMESKANGENGEYLNTKQQIRDHHNVVIMPVEVKEGDSEINSISEKQRQILEKLITDIDLVKVDFLMTMRKRDVEAKTTTISLKVEYDYREIVEIPREQSDQDNLESR